MKKIFFGFLILFSLNLKAQNMKNPIDAITHLFVSTDQRNWEDLKQVFDSEVLLDYSSMNGSPATKLTPDQIIAAWKTILPGFESTHHQLGNFVSNIQENKATVFCYGTASHFLKDDNGNLWTVVGTYDFELRKDAKANWKVSAMKFNFKYQDGNLTLPEKAMNKLK